ncbi:hypothetical protein SLEP1_g27087 [Rubroshorea leprosula]|uniref:Uncharacterized protein n=1 Tax=Rubroshorea leprosula TaxID=152421 RepID=A0AAV5JYL0_9ROSI|nr:hypothetical protein SLEP1_g27087 [Rubroshorea leprosula]
MALSRTRPKIQSKSNSSAFEARGSSVPVTLLFSGISFPIGPWNTEDPGKAVSGAEERLAGKQTRENWGPCLLNFLL